MKEFKNEKKAKTLAANPFKGRMCNADERDLGRGSTMVKNLDLSAPNHKPQTTGDLKSQRPNHKISPRSL